MKVATTRSARPVVPIPLSLYDQLLRDEGSDATTAGRIPTTDAAQATTTTNNNLVLLTEQSILHECGACQKEGSLLHARRMKEKDYFDSLQFDHPSNASTASSAAGSDATGVSGGGRAEREEREEREEWYLLDTAWWRKWKEWYFNQRSVPLADQIGRDVWGMDEDVCGVLPPGPITNHVLLHSSSGEGGGERPRSNLRAGTHYRGITKSVWNFFFLHHGGGPVIKRSTLNLYDTTSKK